MESINTAAFTGATSRLFQHVRVAGEPRTDTETTGRSPASRLTDALLRDQRPALQPDADLEAAPVRADKQARFSPDPKASNATAFRYQRTGDAALFLTTQQGDTVQIKIKNQASASLTSSEFQTGDTLVSQFSLASNESSKVSVLVNGDLSADELRAIGGVLEQVSAVAQDFFNGNVSAAFATAERFNMDGAQLANAAIDMNFEEVLTYSPPTRPALPTQSIASPVGDTEPAAESDPAGVSHAPLTPSPADLQAGGPAPREAKRHLLGAPHDPQRAHPPGQDEALDTIDAFLKGLLDTLKRPAPGEHAGDTPAVGMALKIKLFQSVITTAADNITQAEPTATPLPALVGDTLDALSAKHEPPLTAVV